MYANPPDAGAAKADQPATTTPDLNEQLEWLKATRCSGSPFRSEDYGSATIARDQSIDSLCS